MNSSIFRWLLEKAKVDLREAISNERELKRIAVEMMKRQKGKDGWDREAWKGEGTKAYNEFCAAAKYTRRMRKVVCSLTEALER